MSITSNPTLQAAAARLEAAGIAGAALAVTPDGFDGRRGFAITLDASGKPAFTGSTPAALFAGVCYYLHHKAYGHSLPLPLRRIAPEEHRLITEDFPFDCYWPTGCDSDLDNYAANLAALGFTAMECNRYSREMPLLPYHWSYQHTNPSPAPFFKTPVTRELWSDDIIEANHAELERTVAAAVKYNLEPTFTIFLPRPYPEKLFEKHPGWRGAVFNSPYLQAGGHDPVYALNTDNPEVMEFYRQIFSQMLDDFPQLKNFFFWHSDLGTGFLPDGQGLPGKTLASRIGDFQRMLKAEIDRRGLDIRIWVNPWGIGPEHFQAIANELPPGVGFTIKDTPGLATFEESSPYSLPDATVTRANLGDIPKMVREQATRSHRRFCLGQYLDFSEDLDPIPAVPHAVMTYRKFRTLATIPHDASAAHWGIISPEVAPQNINQEVIREMNWGDDSKTFAELLQKLLPDGLDFASREFVSQFLNGVDDAMRLWPQFWGLRLEDSGLRGQWLIRPFGPKLTEEDLNPEWLLQRQIYHIPYDAPYQSYMSLTPAQALEVHHSYRRIHAILQEALACLQAAIATTDVAKELLLRMEIPVRTLDHIFSSYANLLGYFAFRDCPGLGDDPLRQAQCLRVVRDEVRNLKAFIPFLSEHPEALLHAAKPWGQCLGPDFIRDFTWKLHTMEKQLR